MPNPYSTYTPTSPDEADFLAGYDPSKYPRSEVTADIVLLTIRDGDLCVLLVRRGGFPYKGQWALPGGFVEQGESLDAAAHRELHEETGLTGSTYHLEQLGTYGDPGRDPRARVISVAYLGLLPDIAAPQHGSDADDARFWRVADLAEEGITLAFDHDRILADALERAASKLEYTPLATTFCRPEFTIGELRRVYEAVWGTPVDAVTFRKLVLRRDGFIEPLERHRDTGGRPAELYKAGSTTLLHPAMLRPAVRDRLTPRD